MDPLISLFVPQNSSPLRNRSSQPVERGFQAEIQSWPILSCAWPAAIVCPLTRFGRVIYLRCNELSPRGRCTWPPRRFYYTFDAARSNCSPRIIATLSLSLSLRGSLNCNIVAVIRTLDDQNRCCRYDWRPRRWICRRA